MKKPMANRLGRTEALNGEAAAPASSGWAVTERESIVTHLRMLADHIGARPAGSEEATRAQRYVIQAIRDRGFSPDIQPFFVATSRYERCELVTEGGLAVPCLPVVGSASTAGSVRGIPRAFPPGALPGRDTDCKYAGTFLVCPLRPGAENEHVRLALERRPAAVLFYHEGVPDLYSEVLPSGFDGVTPCVTIRRADAQWFAVECPRVRLTLTRTLVKISCSNILVEAGKGGRPLLFLAHYDTRPGCSGAFRNASGVAALLELLTRLRGWTGHRIVVGFLDAEELGGAGSQHCCDVFQAVGGLRNTRGVVYVSGMGLRRVAVLSAPSHSAPHLVDVARRCAADERILLPDELFPPGEVPIPPGVWPHPTMALSGPPLAIQHTSADRPDLLHPGCLAQAVSLLDRLARAS